MPLTESYERHGYNRSYPPVPDAPAAMGSSARSFLSLNASISSAVTFSEVASKELYLRLLPSASSAAFSLASSFFNASLTWKIETGKGNN